MKKSENKMNVDAIFGPVETILPGTCLVKRCHTNDLQGEVRIRNLVGSPISIRWETSLRDKRGKPTGQPELVIRLLPAARGRKET